MFSVYIIVNNVTGKGYVGITKMSVQRRWQKHQSEARKGNGWLLHASIRKHGLNAFEVCTVAENLDRQTATEMEKQWIVKQKTREPFGYNLTDGGDGTIGYQHTEEWKQELSRRWSGRKMEPEHIEAMRQSLTGYKHTDEAKTNMTAAQIGRKHSPETIQKMQESARRRWETNPRISTPEEQERLRNLAVGTTRTLEHKGKISAALKGKPKSAEHRAKLSAARIAMFAAKKANISAEF